MRVCIVGHGPSLQKSPRGLEIDGHDFVVRLKKSQQLLEYPAWFGTKVDVLCASFTLAPHVIDYPTPEVWIFFDTRHENVSDKDVAHVDRMYCQAGTPRLRYNKHLCDQWDRMYRAMRTGPWERPEQAEAKGSSSDDLGHRHMSAGMKALVYVCAWLDPTSVTLAGFDSVLSGEWTWSATRGPDWQNYPDHRFDVEHRMLPFIAEEFKTEIRGL